MQFSLRGLLGLAAISLILFVAPSIGPSASGQPSDADLTINSAKHVSSDKTKSVGKLINLSQRLSAKEMKEAMIVECIQPDYQLWNRIKPGMPLDEARKILGEPLETAAPRPRPGITAIARLRYGRISFDDRSLPQPFDFELLASGATVYSKQTPFPGKLEESDKPSVPALITPAEGAKFQHYPRFMDFRWYPSSGDYPIAYEVQIQYGHPSYESDKKTRVNRPSVRWEGYAVATIETKVPYHVWSFSSSGPGRWRVKAKNHRGQSAWSQWRAFDFSLDENRR